MAAFAGDRWRCELPNHDIFTKMRDGVLSDGRARHSSAVKDLSFCLGADLFVWDEADSVFHTANLRQLDCEETPSSAQYQASTLHRAPAPVQKLPRSSVR
uniref:Uncharacterized protein n=1 Tax=Denticeps clupeoides TaxID=299321 RepID=A0AAY4DKE1_9TELE